MTNLRANCIYLFLIILFDRKCLCRKVSFGNGFYSGNLEYPPYGDFNSQSYSRNNNENNERKLIWENPNPNPPSFDNSLPRNVTALKGNIAYLYCNVHNVGNKTVSWIREQDLHILTVNQQTYTADDRFEVMHKPNTNSWMLKINGVQPRDSGRYDCQVNTHPTDPKTFSVWLNVFVPTARILGSAERYVDRGSTINLTCIIRHHLQPRTEQFWYHNNREINYDSRDKLVSVITDRGAEIKTILLIHDASDAASGTYSCFPSPYTAASVRIHILNGETPAAMQTNSCIGCLRIHSLSFILSFLVITFSFRKVFLRIWI